MIYFFMNKLLWRLNDSDGRIDNADADDCDTVGVIDKKNGY